MIELMFVRLESIDIISGDVFSLPKNDNLSSNNKNLKKCVLDRNKKETAKWQFFLSDLEVHLGVILESKSVQKGI